MSLKHCVDVTFMLGNKLSTALPYVYTVRQRKALQDMESRDQLKEIQKCLGCQKGMADLMTALSVDL